MERRYGCVFVASAPDVNFPLVLPTKYKNIYEKLCATSLKGTFQKWTALKHAIKKHVRCYYTNTWQLRLSGRGLVLQSPEFFSRRKFPCTSWKRFYAKTHVPEYIFYRDAPICRRRFRLIFIAAVWCRPRRRFKGTGASRRRKKMFILYKILYGTDVQNVRMFSWLNSLLRSVGKNLINVDLVSKRSMTRVWKYLRSPFSLNSLRGLL